MAHGRDDDEDGVDNTHGADDNTSNRQPPTALGAIRVVNLDKPDNAQDESQDTNEKATNEASNRQAIPPYRLRIAPRLPIRWLPVGRRVIRRLWRVTGWLLLW